MPQSTSMRPGAAVGADAPRARRGLAAFGLLACVAALALAGCQTAGAQSPIGAGSPVGVDATLDTSAGPVSEVSLAPGKSAVPATGSVTVPTPVLTTAATGKPSLCGAPPNPFGYNFCGRGGEIRITSMVVSAVCDYFDCIGNFQVGTGYMVECKDATYALSGGSPDACSDHKGVLRTVYSG
jgi:hypothetical protein